MAMLLLAASLAGHGWARVAEAEPPRIVQTTPADMDLYVDPELTEIRAVFDQDMDPWGFSFVGGGPTFPETTGEPRWETARVTVLPVRLKPGWYYEVGFNEPPFTNFRNTVDDAAAPHRVRFCTAVPEGDPRRLHPEQNEAALARLRQAIDERYSYRDRLDLDWDALFEAHRDALLAAPIGDAFALLAGRMLAAAEDPHISLSTPVNSFPSDRRIVPMNVDYSGLLAAMPNLRQGQGVVGARLTKDIGYLMLPSWSFPAARDAELRKALEEVIDCAGLIVDVRPNGGGDELRAQAFASCFLAAETPYAMHVWRDIDQNDGWSAPVTRVLVPDDDAPFYPGKVVVLMGPRCMSSNEAFLMMMRQAPGCVLLGENSFGSSGNPKPVDLLNGVTVNLPSWKAMTLDGREFEGEGIRPDIEVKATLEELRREDPLLARARQIIEASIEATGATMEGQTSP